MSSEPEVAVVGSADELATEVAAQACALLADAQRERGVAHCAVTGGSILERVFVGIANAGADSDVDWSNVHLWWGDERYVPAGSADRNDVPACAKLIDRLPFDAAKVHRMPASDAGFAPSSGADAAGDPDGDADGLGAAADAYAAELAAAAADGDVPPFDVVLLGLGPDGHCCSLFPNHPGTRVADRTVIGVRESPKPPPMRLSLTFPALNAAREIWVIAAGDGKADAVAKALAPDANREQVPSSGLRGRARTRWLLDEAAAGLLGR